MRSRSGIEFSDVAAATLIVGKDLIEADFLTIDGAIANLPPEGGAIFVMQGIYTISVSIVLPDKPIVIRGAGDGTVIKLSGVALAAFTAAFTMRTVTIEDLLVDGSSGAGNKVLDVTAILDSTHKILLSRVSSINTPILYKSVVTNAGIVEFVDCRSSGVVTGWDSGGDGTLIVKDHVGTFGPIVGATDSAVLIARNTTFGAIDVGIAKLVDCVSTAILTLYKLRSEVFGHLFDFTGRAVDIVAASSLNDFVACKFKPAAAETVRIAGTFNNFSDCDSLIVLETAGADNNRYEGIHNTPNVSTIVGPDSVLNGNKKKGVTAGVTTIAFVNQFTFTNQNGIGTYGTVKNTGGVNAMEVRETGIDAFGVTTSVTTTVAAGGVFVSVSAFLGLAGTSFPPFVSYAVDVRHPVAATTFNLQWTGQGTM